MSRGVRDGVAAELVSAVPLWIPAPASADARSAVTTRSVGVAYLVGAGPGDPELITVKGLACLRRADVVLYDRLVHPALLDEAPPHAERIFCGKAPGEAAMAQQAIQELMVGWVQAGLVVVRLKGGDPYVFGRGGEEGTALTAAGLPWQVVPGVSSAVAVPALAGIPLTYRGVAASFAVITGHQATERRSSFGCEADTLVILMGVARLPQLVSELIRRGRSPATPAAAVERGSLPGEHVLITTLGALPMEARRHGLRAPATLVVGEVVRLRAALTSHPSTMQRQEAFS